MTKRRLRQLQALGLVAASLIFLGIKHIPFISGASSQTAAEHVIVERVVDGDTLKLSDGRRVRLIGIDTPEKHYSKKLLKDAQRSGRNIKAIQALGEKASDFTKTLCFGKRIRLEFDVVKQDKYGRLLAYVYLDDGTFINARILEEGYAQIMTIPPNVKYEDHFLKLQQQAREGRKGLWGIDKDGM